MSEQLKEKESETIKEAQCENGSFDHNDLKEFTSTPKEKKENVEKLDPKDVRLSCKECNYSCKKEKSLKNHILTKHEHHQCKECQEKLPNFMQLLKHIASHHNKDQNEIQVEEEALENVEESKGQKELDYLEELEAEFL